MSVVFEALQMLEGEQAGFRASTPPLPIELVRRSEHPAPLNWQTLMNKLGDEGERSPDAVKPRPRPVGSPLQMGGLKPEPVPIASPALTVEEVPASALAVAEEEVPDSAPAVAVQESHSEASAGIQDALAALCSAIPPFVQRILPLFEAGPQLATVPQYSSAPLIDLVPIEGCLVELKTQHSNLREEVVEQIATLKRTEDQLQAVREATERNTVEQKELIQAFKGVHRKTNLVATVTLGMLAVSIVIEIALFLHFPIR